MPTVTMRLDVAPESQKRPRHSARHGFVRMHKAPSDVANEATIAALAAPHKPVEVITGPVMVRIMAVMPRPKGMATVSKRTGLPLHEALRYPHTSRPDSDNLAKAILDSLKSWWRDDAQVWRHEVTKLVAQVGEQPHWEVTVDW